jgi:hypothetical protein
MLCAVGRYDDSRRAFAEFRGRWPQLSVFISAPMTLAATVGDAAELESLRELAAGFSNPPPHLQEALRRSATLWEPTARRRQGIVERLREQVAQNDTPDVGLLLLAHQVGLAEEAFAIIEAASFSQVYSEDGPPPTGKLSPGIIFDRTTSLSMIEDPRFVGLCAKLGLCEYWSVTGQWPDCAAYTPYDFKAEVRRRTPRPVR